MKKPVLILGMALSALSLYPQFSIKEKSPRYEMNGQTVWQAPEEGLWSVATSWENDWMGNWKHASPVQHSRSGEWDVLTGSIVLPQGEILLRDSYRELPNGLIQCIRRYEWKGKEMLPEVTLSVRYQVAGDSLKPFLPGILYYGNVNGAKVNPNIIPVYDGKAGEFAIFEEHRYPMPFAMLENAPQQFAVALHTTPSPVRGARLSDQWWSLGVENKGAHSELLLYSGPIGYNRQHSVAKALQSKPMKYTDTYLNLEPGRIVEKEFFIETNPIGSAGTGFQQPVHNSIEMHQPFNRERFTPYDDIIRSKYKFALGRWIDSLDCKGFGMYDLNSSHDIVMGWCGQADSPGFALQLLEKRLQDPSIPGKVQELMDFLSDYPAGKEGIFPVGYNFKKQSYYGGDPVSCGQAMYNFAKAIVKARKDKRYDTRKWEAFLQKACDATSERILDNAWNPKSTAEAFYIAPLAIASNLFKNKQYRQAAEKATRLFSERHTESVSYWGGTLDATCEDKEGAWAAFQGYLEMYEQYKKPEYLELAKHAMDVCLSYTVVWDIPLPAGRLADYNFKSTGWTVVSPQNQHIDVYGVLFAPEVYKMGSYLKNEDLKKLAAVMFRSCSQLTDPFGSQGEQLQQTNFAQHGDMTNVYQFRGGYSERWTVFWITAHFLNAAARFEEMNVEV